MATKSRYAAYYKAVCGTKDCKKKSSVLEVLKNKKVQSEKTDK